MQARKLTPEELAHEDEVAALEVCHGTSGVGKEVRSEARTSVLPNFSVASNVK